MLFLGVAPGVAELADARDSKSRGTWYRVGSTPSYESTVFKNPDIIAKYTIFKPFYIDKCARSGKE